MAQNLILNILANDKTKIAFNNVGASLTRLRASVFSVKSALLGLGVGATIKSIIKVGAEVEQLGARFNFLFGSVEEGKKAFSGMINFASQVPFSLEAIASASTNLAVVSKDAEELQKNLKITGNVAFITGLDFQTTAEQISKSFNKGINSARIFQEKGVASLLGFKAGAEITGEETIKRFEELFGENGRFGKATEVLSTTFTGTLAKLQNKLFKFKQETNESGFFDFIKNALVVIDRLIGTNSKQLTTFATNFGQSLVVAIKEGILGIARLMDLFKHVFAIIGAGIGGLFNLIAALPPGIREIGIIGFLMLGRKGKLIVAGIAGLLKVFKIDLEEISEKIFGSSDNTEQWGKNSEAVAKFIQDIESNIKLSKEQLAELNKLIEKNTVPAAEKISFSFEKVLITIRDGIKKELESVNQTIGEFILKGVNDFSQALAEVLVLGKEIKMTFQEFAQKILVQITAELIKHIIYRQLEKILGIDILATEAKKTNEIKKQNTELKRQMLFNTFTGGMGGGFSGFAQGGAVSKGQPIVVGERGAEMFIPNSTGQISQSARGTGGGAVSVNFNINTLDARGFDELLVRNRGTITQIINSAVNERGGKNLI